MLVVLVGSWKNYIIILRMVEIYSRNNISFYAILINRVKQEFITNPNKKFVMSKLALRLRIDNINIKLIFFYLLQEGFIDFELKDSCFNFFLSNSNVNVIGESSISEKSLDDLIINIKKIIGIAHYNHQKIVRISELYDEFKKSNGLLK